MGRFSFSLFFLLFSSASVYGYESSVEGGVSMSYTDNAAFQSQNRQNDLILELGGRYRFWGESSYSRLLTDLGASYQHYLQDTFANQVTVDGMVQLAAIIAPKQVEWIFEDYVTDVFNNPTRLFRPTDRSRLNIFSTGPTLMSVINPANTIVLDLRHVIVNDEAGIDSVREKAEATLDHKFSEVSGFSFVLFGEQVKFDAQEQGLFGVVQDFNRYEAFIMPYRDSQNTHLEFDIGVTEIERLEDNEKDLLARWGVKATYFIPKVREFTVELSQRHSDSVNDLISSSIASSRVDSNGLVVSDLSSSVSSLQDQTVSSLSVEDSSNAIIEQKNAAISLQLFGDIVDFYSTAYVERRTVNDLFYANGQDRLRRGIDFAFGKRVSPRLDFSLGIFTSKSLFDDRDTGVEYLQSYVTRMTYLVARRVEFSGQISRDIRKDVADSFEQNAEENRIMFSLYYLPKS